MPLNHPLKFIKIVKFLIYIYCHNKNNFKLLKIRNTLRPRMSEIILLRTRLRRSESLCKVYLKKKEREVNNSTDGMLI